MGKEIDEKVVSMKFDNKQFAEKTAETMSMLDKLKEKLRFPGASKGFDEVSKAAGNTDLSGMSTAVEKVGLKFNALQVMATTALMNITNSAVNAGKRIASALTIDPIKEGFSEYELTLNAVQTTMAGTGKTAEEVEKELKKLDEYADQTVYSTADMLNNLPKFTNAGVDLDKAVTAMIGIANATAHAGGDAGKASIAFYNLGQAIGTGYLSRMDYNSINNAGIATMEWKEQMVEAAIAQGTLTKVGEDQYKAGNKTLSLQQLFIDGLQEQWATTDVLMKVFGDYGDTTTEIGKKAQSAAQDVKTFSQLMDTLKASAGTGWKDTWQILIGGLDDAKTLWTGVSDVFGKIISDSAKARNALLQGWADGGGRTMMIDSFKNVWQALLSVITPIKEAFRDIFPKTTSEQLVKITEAIKDFTSKLILSEKAQDKLKSTFKGLFAAIDIVITAIKEIVKGTVKLLGSLWGLVSGLLGVGSSFGDWISGMRDTIKESSIFGTVIGGIVKVLEKFINAIKIVINALKEKFVAPGFEGLLGILNGLWKVIKFIGEKIAQVVGALGKGLLTAFRSGDIKAAVDVFNSGIIATILLGIKKFVNGFADSFDGIAGIGSSFKGILDSVKGCFVAWQQEIKAKTLMTIASAIAILAVSILVISSIDPSRLAASLGAVGVLFAELMVSMNAFSAMPKNLKGTFKAMGLMVSMSIAVLILASALKKIASLDWKQLAVGIAGLYVVMLFLVQALGTINSQEGKVKKVAAQLIGMAVAVDLLVIAIKVLGGMDLVSLAKGLGGVIVALGAMVGAMAIMSKFKSKGVAQLIGMAVALDLLAISIAVIGRMDLVNIAKGVGALVVVLYALVGAAAIMSKVAIGAVAMLVLAGSLAIFAVALTMMIPAFAAFMLLDMNAVCGGLLKLAGTLVVLGVAAVLSPLLVLLAWGLKSLGAGLTAMIPGLVALTLLDFAGLCVTLLKFAGILVLLGVAALVAPLLVLLGAGLTVLGVGALLAGPGLAALAIGLTAFAAALPAALNIIVVGITTIISAIIGMIPAIIEAIGNGIILICNVIANSAGSICNAISAIIIAVSDAIIKAIPKLTELTGKLLDMLIKVISEYVPKIIKLGIELILALLDGIAQNIEKVVEKAVEVVNAFLRGIGKETPKLVVAAFEMILDFINGIADAIEKYTPQLMEACVNLGISIVKGVVKGLTSIPNLIWEGIKSVGNTIWNGFKDFFGINSPAKKMIPIGQGLDEGMVVGLEKYKGLVVNASEDVGSSAVKSMSNAISGISDVINSDIDSQPVIRPVLDLSNIESGASAINSMFGMNPSVDVMSNVGAINSMMNNNQNGGNFDVISAIKDLGNKISEMSNNSYTINGITYDDGSNIAIAVNDLVRAAKMERRI